MSKDKDRGFSGRGLGSALLGQMGAGLVTGIPTFGYAHLIGALGAPKNMKPENKTLFKALARQAVSEGTKIFPRENRYEIDIEEFNRIHKDTIPDTRDTRSFTMKPEFLKSMGPNAVGGDYALTPKEFKLFTGSGTVFDGSRFIDNIRGKIPLKNQIHLLGVKDPDILAHEMGHIGALRDAKKGRLLSKLTHGKGLTKASLIAASLGSLGSIVQFASGKGDTDSARNLAILGSVGLGAGLLPREIDASIRGSKLVSQAALKSGQKLSRMKKLAPFKGLPTYGLKVAGPLMAYGIASALNKKSEKPKKGIFPIDISRFTGTGKPRRGFN